MTILILRIMFDLEVLKLFVSKIFKGGICGDFIEFGCSNLILVITLKGTYQNTQLLREKYVGLV
jgi:hypothetical protein